MPCRYYTTEEELAIANSNVNDCREELDRVTQLLCSTCRFIFNSEEPASEAMNAIAGLAEWWTEHEKMDTKRIQAEQRAKEEVEKKQEEERITEQIRQNALEKLTAHEIIALGIR